MKLVVATRNAHKLAEIGQIFAMPGLELVSLDTYPGAPEVIEDGDTFEKNAVKKALSATRYTGEWSMADDSGLEVAALDGAPGVWSARYAGEPVDHAANNAKLLKELCEKRDRTACFRCVIAFAGPDGETATADGFCRGKISMSPAGKSGFGYDPLFLPDGYDRTFAELGSDVKNRISHRAAGLRAAAELWHQLTGN